MKVSPSSSLGLLNGSILPSLYSTKWEYYNYDLSITKSVLFYPEKQNWQGTAKVIGKIAFAIMAMPTALIEVIGVNTLKLACNGIVYMHNQKCPSSILPSSSKLYDKIQSAIKKHPSLKKNLHLKLR